MDDVTRTAQRILVVEDVQETRRLIKDLLQRDGYVVDGAAEEEEAVERIRWHRPDLILVSIGGTTEQILATARRIRERPGSVDDVPIVIFSIANIPQGAEYEIEGQVYVTVPDNFDQLRALLARVLHGRSRKN